MTHDALTPDVHHDPDARRLHTRVEGHEAELRYSLCDGRMVIDHTGVPDAIGGRGIAGILVKAALDLAREVAREGAGSEKIGTTGKGIGPTYEDKIARRALRVQDLKHPERFAAKLRALLDLHNHVLTTYLNAAPIDFDTVYKQAMADADIAPRLRPWQPLLTVRMW